MHAAPTCGKYSFTIWRIKVSVSRVDQSPHLYHGNRPGTEDPSSARPRNHGSEGFLTQSNFPRCLLLFLASFLLL